MQTIFLLNVQYWGEGRTSAMCLNPLEPSVYLNVTSIQIIMLLLDVGLFEYEWTEMINSKYQINIGNESNQEGQKKRS